MLRAICRSPNLSLSYYPPHQLRNNSLRASNICKPNTPNPQTPKMQDLIPIMPSCFSSSSGAGEKTTDINPSSSTAAATKLGQSAVLSSYRTLIAGRPRIVTVTWCKTLLALGLYVSIESSSHNDNDDRHNASAADDDISSNVMIRSCKVEMRPWHFWRRHGTKSFHVDGHPVGVFWDLKAAKFSAADDPEPLSDYYVAVVSGSEVVLLLGDQKHDAFRRTGSRPSMFDPVLVSKKEHVFGKRRFVTRAKFEEKGKKFHEVCVECINGGGGSNSTDCEMVIKIDGSVGVSVKHLQWKFRGHDCVWINEKVRVEVYWDVHDWLFGSSTSGLRHALFIFKPVAAAASSSLGSCCVDHHEGGGVNGEGSSDFCLFLYAWKLE